MEFKDMILLLHPMVAVIVVFPLLGVVKFLQQWVKNTLSLVFGSQEVSWVWFYWHWEMM
jgi:hypothetical protein